MNLYRSDLFVHLSGLAVSDVSGIAEEIATVRMYPSDVVILRNASKQFSDVGRADYAHDLFLRLDELGALTSEDRTRFGAVLLDLGEARRATNQFARLTEEQPHNADHLISLAVALMNDGRSGQAARLLLLRTNRHLDNGRYLYQLGAALGNAKRYNAANLILQHLADIMPDYPGVGKLRAGLLGAAGYHDRAWIVASMLETDEPEVFLMLSAFSLALGHPQRALQEIEAGIELYADEVRLILQRAQVRAALHQHRLAAADIDFVLAQNLKSEAVERLAFSVFTEAGRYVEGLPIGARLLARYPDDTAIAATLRVVIERLGLSPGLRKAQDNNNSAFVPPPPLVNRPRNWEKPENSALTQWRIIIALLLRESRTRFGRSRLGYAWVLFEPIAHIGIMIVLISFLSHSRVPPIGESFALFYFTGIIPYHLFTHTVSHVMKSVPENRPLLQLPVVRAFDVYAARGLLELITEIVVACVLLLFFAIAGLAIIPINPSGVAIGLILLWFGAVGVGMIFAVLCAFFSAWERIWGALASILYFSSGTFYIPRIMPENIRAILSWNPLLQAIEFIRSNYFYQPHPYWLNLPYFAGFCIGILALGVCVERAFRRKLMGIE
tara:strand:+ start:3989 stop:5824 length:1836 start_codon:yes stop_codon:yes gene_type:complete